MKAALKIFIFLAFFLIFNILTPLSNIHQIRATSKVNNQETSVISGFKWHDKDHNGKWEKNEHALGGWRIEIDYEPSNTNFTPDAHTTTNEYGYYDFNVPSIGDYRVCEVNLPGWEQTNPLNCHDLTITEYGQVLRQNNFGNYEDLVPIVSISPDNPTIEKGEGIALTAEATNGNKPYQSYTWYCSNGLEESGTSLSQIIFHESSRENYNKITICSVSVLDTDGDIATDSVAIMSQTIPDNNDQEGHSQSALILGEQAQVLQNVQTLFTQVEENEDKPKDNVEEKDQSIGGILGAVLQICKEEEKARIWGYIYLENNSNNSKDEGEVGIKDIQIEIYTTVDNKEDYVNTVSTNEDGYWSENLCPGDYIIRINKINIPMDARIIGGDSKNVTVITDSDTQGINFPIELKKTLNFIWYFIPLFIILLLIFVVITLIRRKVYKSKKA